MDGNGYGGPDFFISRAGAHPADAAMAQKIASILDRAGKDVVVQDWDFKNRNFMERMDRALASGARVIAILTPQYLASDYCRAEWMHALHRDPLNTRGRLIVLRAAECEPDGLLRTIAYWDLLKARDDDALLAAIVADAILPDAARRRLPVDAYWREARPLRHPAIRFVPDFTERQAEIRAIYHAPWTEAEHAARVPSGHRAIVVRGHSWSGGSSRHASRWF